MSWGLSESILRRLIKWVAWLSFYSCTGLTVFEGVQYRIRENQGLDPVPASVPVGILTMVTAGVLAVSLLALLIMRLRSSR
jgi:hypothetical protein